LRFKYESRIGRIAGELDNRMKLAARFSAEAIEAGAKSRVPVQSGSLRDSIHTVETDDGYMIVAGDSDVFYGHIVEHGSVNTAPRPFLIPAAEAERDHVDEHGRRALGTLD
jgi:HK97 gp10 family phage protein